MIRKLMIGISLMILVAGCAASRKSVNIEWAGLKGSIVRVVDPRTGKILVEEDTSVNDTFMLAKNSSRPYFVEVKTPQGENLYGTVDVLYVTETAKMTTAPFEFTRSDVQEILDGSVKSITVTDPAVQLPVCEIRLGKSMTPEMRMLYDRKKIGTL